MSTINKNKVWFLVACLYNQASSVYGPTGLLTIGYTRNGVVGHALFALTVGHSHDVSLIQIGGGNYYQFELKIYVNWGNIIYILLNDSFSDQYHPIKEDMDVCITFLANTITNGSSSSVGITGYKNHSDFVISEDFTLAKTLTTKPM